MKLPLFPLDTVLFPGCMLDLQIFEARYLDMVSQCLKAGHGFGVVHILDGSEVCAARVMPCRWRTNTPTCWCCSRRSASTPW